MRVTKCDFCQANIPGDDKTVMLYDVSIWAAADYKAESRAEKSVLFDAEEVCLPCARQVRSVLVRLRTQIRKAH